MLLRIQLCCFFLLLPALARAQVDPSVLNRILREHRQPADSDDLDWGAIAAKEREGLKRLLASLPRIEPERWKALNQDQQKAFWMNAHLAIVVWAVTANYPIKGDRIRFLPESSVQQIPDFWEARYPFPLGRRESLRSIEEKLADEFRDVRALAALYLGARGGPPPPREAWSGLHLSQRIERQLSRYYRSPRGARLDPQTRTVSLSATALSFWRKDILRAVGPEGARHRHALPEALRIRGEHEGGKWPQYDEETSRILTFLGPYLPPSMPGRLKAARYEVAEIPFDWSLNDGTPPPAPAMGIPLDVDAPYKDKDYEPGEMPVPPRGHLPRIPRKKRKPDEIVPLLE